jgi:hypothetical protein
MIFNPSAPAIAFVWQFKFPALRARFTICLLHEIRARRSIRTLPCFSLISRPLRSRFECWPNCEGLE